MIVFGRKGHDVSEDDAFDYVGGYATGNDFSARKMQMETSQFLAGKTSDGFAPLGLGLSRATASPIRTTCVSRPI